MQVPGSKEDIFKNRDLPLLEKRRLMRFLVFAGGPFEGSSELRGNENAPFLQFLRDAFALNEDLAQVITYSLAFCTFPSDPTLPALQRARRYLQSAGRYGPSSFIVGHYGGAGEISQGFSRTSAVHGGVYILGKRILSIHPNSSGKEPHPILLKLDEFPDCLSCDVMVSPQDYLVPELFSAATVIPSSTDGRNYAIARCIAIIDKPISFHSSGFFSINTQISQPTFPPPGAPHSIDNGVLIFPPASLEKGSSKASATVLITGESSMSAPKGKHIIYLSVPILDNDIDSSPEPLLQPYLTATLSCISPSSDGMETNPLFKVFYIEHPPRHEFVVSAPNPKIIVTPFICSTHPESLDSAAINAEAVFRKVVGILKSRDPLCPPEANVEDENLWPPLNEIDDEEDNW